jgi:thiamine-phosphate pyrophosphorylase
LKDCKLYVIIDREIIKNKDILRITKDILRGGADIIQLRDKSSPDGNFLRYAKVIKKITKKYKCLFIVNDKVDIAYIVDADGVHLGQNDIPIEEARKILGAKIIGVSTHNLKEAKKAAKKGADYIGIGPVFTSKTKKGLSPIGLSILRRVSKTINIPFFAIGGIALTNIAKVKRAGANRVAVISSVLKTKSACRSVRKLKEAISRT